MKRVLLSILVLVFLSAPAQAVLIAAWNFNNEADRFAVSHGSGTMTTSVTVAAQQFFTGTTINAVSGDAAGQAFSPQGGTDLPNNGANFTFAISTVGLQDLVMSFATQRTSSGFNSNQVAWSSDGGSNFTNLGSPFDPPLAFAAMSFDFSSISALNNNANVQIRITLNGATTSSGNNRYDNVQFNAVPEPATLALLLIGGLALARRRR